MPRKFECLRHVEFYDKLVSERFERCLDLYLCPRIRKKKLDMDPEALIPNLPKPSDLRPFPTAQNIQYRGHTSRVRAISVHPSGQFLASCGEKGEVIVWDVLSSRTLWRYQMPQFSDEKEADPAADNNKKKAPGKPGVNYALQFSASGLLAVANDCALYIFALEDVLPSAWSAENRKMLAECRKLHDLEVTPVVRWQFINEEE